MFALLKIKAVHAEKNDSKMQYSDGFTEFNVHVRPMPLDELKKQSKSFQRGYAAAKKAYEKSGNVKFK